MMMIKFCNGSFLSICTQRLIEWCIVNLHALLTHEKRVLLII